MINTQVRLGNLKDGDVACVKLATDGTQVTKKQTATVTTVTLGNEVQALQIGTIAIVLTGETYEASKSFKVEIRVLRCVHASP